MVGVRHVMGGVQIHHGHASMPRHIQGGRAGHGCGASEGYGDRDTPEAVTEWAGSTRVRSPSRGLSCKHCSYSAYRMDQGLPLIWVGIRLEMRACRRSDKVLEPLHDGSCHGY